MSRFKVGDCSLHHQTMDFPVSTHGQFFAKKFFPNLVRTHIYILRVLFGPSGFPCPWDADH